MTTKRTELRIEPVDKGFIVHHSDDIGIGKYKPPTKHLFTTHADMIAHVAKVTKPSGTPKTMKESMQQALANAKVIPAQTDDTE